MSNFDTITLGNGLKIYLYSDTRKHSIFFDFITFCGGMSKDFIIDGNEVHLPDGLAHILEHYIVECNDDGNFLKFLGEKQMNTNASTGPTSTEFYFETVQDVAIGIKTILSAINNVTFTDEKLEKIKGPILQEIRGKMNNKYYHLNRLMMNDVFNDISFRDVGGTLDEISNTTISLLDTFYRAFYRPDNQCIVVAGNFNKEEVLNEIKSFYNDRNFEKSNIEMIKHNETDKINKVSDVLCFSTPREYRVVYYKINVSSFSNVDLLDLSFYVNCFFNNFFGQTSKLYKKLIDEGVITDTMNCGVRQIDNYMILSIGNFTSNGDYFANSVIDTVSKMNSFSKKYFELDKKGCILSLIIRDENIFSMINPFIYNLVNLNYPYLDKVDDLYRLGYDDYVSTIKKLDFSNYCDIKIIDDDKEKKRN